MLLIIYRENRYVLFLTENYAALDILKNPKNYLSDKINISKSGKQSEEQASKDVQPYVLFGSSFPKDKEYTQVNTHKCHISKNCWFQMHEPIIIIDGLIAMLVVRSTISVEVFH